MNLRRLLPLIGLAVLLLAAASGCASGKVGFDRPWSLSEFYTFCWTDEHEWSLCDYGVVCRDFQSAMDRDFVSLEECLEVCDHKKNAYFPNGLTNGCYQAASDASATCDSYCRRLFKQAQAQGRAQGQPVPPVVR